MRQHTGRPGQCCSGLGGLANCFLYVCPSAPQINVAWLERGLSVDNPIIFSEPGPLNSLLPGQMWRSPVRCSRVTKGWPDQRCFNKASNVCLFVTGAGWNPLRGLCCGAIFEDEWKLIVQSHPQMRPLRGAFETNACAFPDRQVTIGAVIYEVPPSNVIKDWWDESTLIVRPG